MSFHQTPLQSQLYLSPQHPQPPAPLWVQKLISLPCTLGRNEILSSFLHTCGSCSQNPKLRSKCPYCQSIVHHPLQRHLSKKMMSFVKSDDGKFTCYVVGLNASLITWNDKPLKKKNVGDIGAPIHEGDVLTFGAPSTIGDISDELRFIVVAVRPRDDTDNATTSQNKRQLLTNQETKSSNADDETQQYSFSSPALTMPQFSYTCHDQSPTQQLTESQSVVTRGSVMDTTRQAVSSSLHAVAPVEKKRRVMVSDLDDCQMKKLRESYSTCSFQYALLTIAIRRQDAERKKSVNGDWLLPQLLRGTIACQSSC